VSEPTPAAAPPRRGALYAAAALSGAAVMTVELTATRLFAPWFGASIYAWTNVVAVVLLALSAGYAIGGRAADRRPSARGLAVVLLVAAGWLAAAAAFGAHAAAAFAPSTTGDPGDYVVALMCGSFAAGGLVFGPPLFLLGWTGPFVTRLLTDGGLPSGAAAGRALAVSTAGSLVGTYLPAFFLLERVGSRGAVLAGAALLVAAAALLAAPARGLAAASCVLLAGAALSAATPFVPAGDGETLVRDAESAYQYVRVAEVGAPGGRRYRNLSLDEGRGEFHSRRGLDDGPLTDAYYDHLAVVPDWIADVDRRPLDVLVIGGGAGTLRGLLRRFHDARIRSIVEVEIDPTVTAQSPDFGGPLAAADRIWNVDGRAALRAEGRTYDFVVLDAYARQVAIPAHLGTREAFAAVKARLSPRGVFALNVSAADLEAPLVRALTATLRAEFPTVYAAPVPNSWNVTLLAGARPDPHTAVFERGDALDPIRRAFREFLLPVADPPAGVVPLTDDLAPLESLARRIK
jgi:spermidine synthase